jgi:hypothetical protein
LTPYVAMVGQKIRLCASRSPATQHILLPKIRTIGWKIRRQATYSNGFCLQRFENSSLANLRGFIIVISLNPTHHRRACIYHESFDALMQTSNRQRSDLKKFKN